MLAARYCWRRRRLLRAISHTKSDLLVLGIESSCDDTGAAVVRGNGTLLGESLQSQTHVHLKAGGIIPTVASELHERNIEGVVNSAIERSGCDLDDLSLVAVTTGPGLAFSLRAGVEYAKQLATRISKPLLSVHHMEAHALTVRMNHDIPFPYLVLLISGGHCILATVEGVGHFSRLGQTSDDSPGEALDKVARWLRLDLHPRVCDLPGGAAVEVLAREGRAERVKLPQVMLHSRCCNFSFSGLKTAARNHIQAMAAQSGWHGDGPLPGCEDVCASFQQSVTDHLLTRTYRAILYTKGTNITQHTKGTNITQHTKGTNITQHTKGTNITHLVVSGGVARNGYIRSKLQELGDLTGFRVHFPSPHLCTDNGVMVAWAGVETVMSGGCDRVYSVERAGEVDYTPKWPLGQDLSQRVIEQYISTKKQRVKI